MKALMRVDASRCIGMGHLVRTHALGRKLAGRGVSVLFITAIEDSELWLRSRGAEVVRIDADPGGGEDARILTRLAQENGADWMVTDGYVFREEYLQVLVGTGVPVACIDDLAAWGFPSTLVINGGLGAGKLRYQTPPSTRLLLGPEYMLLRPGFSCAPKKVHAPVERVFVSFGGADPEDWTGQMLEAWVGLANPPTLEVLVGAAYPHLDRLLDKAKRVQARIHCDLDGDAVARLMDACDLAISSAGMVACELAAVCVPSILAVTSDDQKSNASALVGAGAAVQPALPTVQTLLDAARRLIVDPELRKALSHAASKLVDGQGASRVSAVMVGRDDG